jgi:hypothetical protein
VADDASNGPDRSRAELLREVEALRDENARLRELLGATAETTGPMPPTAPGSPTSRMTLVRQARQAVNRRIDFDGLDG